MESLHVNKAPHQVGLPMGQADCSAKVIAHLKAATSEEEIVISSLTITASEMAKRNLLQRKYAAYIFAVDLSAAMEPHL